MNKSRSNLTVRPSNSGLNVSSIPAKASSRATMRGLARGEQLEFEGVPGTVVEDRGEHFAVGVARVARTMVMDHRPEQRAQLGQPVGTEAISVAVEHAGHRGLQLGQ